MKLVNIMAGPTGPTGTFQGVNILSNVTGASGQFAQFGQNTGPTGGFKSVYPVGATAYAQAPTGTYKSIIVSGYSATPVTPVSVSMTDHAEDATAQTTYTWSSKNFAIGAANTTRRVVAAIASRCTAVTNITSVTIGGIAATRVQSGMIPQNVAPSSTIVELWQAAVPTGTTATVSATFGAAQARAGCAVFSVLNAAIVNSIGADLAGSPSTPNVFVAPSGGAIVLSGVTDPTTLGTATATNWIKDLGATLNATTAYAAGHDTTSGTRAHGVTWSGTPVLPTPSIAAAFAPTGYNADKPVNFTTTSGGASNVGATQGMAASASYFFTSGVSTTFAAQTLIRTYANPGWGSVLFTHDAAGDNANPIQQCNGMYVDPVANKLYVGASNYPATPAKGWIYEYTINSDGSLTYIAAHDVTEGAGCWTEGCAKYNGSFWCVFTDRYEIHQYDASWNFVAKWTLPGTKPPAAASDQYFQGISWRGNTAYVNYHGLSTSPGSYCPGIDAFTWNGAGFTLCATGIRPPTRDCGQSIFFDADGVSCWFAERVQNSILVAANVVKATFAELT